MSKTKNRLQVDIIELQKEIATLYCDLYTISINPVSEKSLQLRTKYIHLHRLKQPIVKVEEANVIN